MSVSNFRTINEQQLPTNANKKKCSHLLNWLTDKLLDVDDAIMDPFSLGYIPKVSSHYSERVRNTYELQLWKAYLKVGKETKHWPEEVLQHTGKLQHGINIRFVERKINQLKDSIIEEINIINDLKGQLKSYWTQDLIHRIAEMTTIEVLEIASTENYPHHLVDLLDTYILEYSLDGAQHIKKTIETKIQLVQTQMEDLKTL